jgi:heme a synthase
MTRLMEYPMSDEVRSDVMPGSNHYGFMLQLCAVLVTMSVFPLIWMGGLVTSHGVGMSVPDWPNSYGYNMFLFPPGKWIGGIFYEHTHRLLGTLSGFLTITLALLTWGPARFKRRRQLIKYAAYFLWVAFALSLGFKLILYLGGLINDDIAKNISHVYVLFASLALIMTVAFFAVAQDARPWVRWLVIGQLLLIIIQGTLGGLRVTEVSTELAMIHACTAQLFFTLSGFTALVMSRWWKQLPQICEKYTVQFQKNARLFGGLTIAVCGLIFCQLIAGALMRHNGAGLAIPDVPLAYGQLVPPTDASSLARANDVRRWTYHLPEVSLAQVWMHASHRIGAVLVSLCVLGAATLAFFKLRESRAVIILTAILLLLVTTQMTLGILTVYWQKPADIASLHVAVGALTLLTAGLALAVSNRLQIKKCA